MATAGDTANTDMALNSLEKWQTQELENGSDSKENIDDSKENTDGNEENIDGGINYHSWDNHTSFNKYPTHEPGYENKVCFPHRLPVGETSVS